MHLIHHGIAHNRNSGEILPSVKFQFLVNELETIYWECQYNDNQLIVAQQYRDHMHSTMQSLLWYPLNTMEIVLLNVAFNYRTIVLFM